MGNATKDAAKLPDESGLADGASEGGSAVVTPVLLAYSLPYLSSVFLIAPIGILQGIYAKYFGLSLTVIAGVILVARMFDAVSDPVIGYLSDWHRARSGTRKPLMVAGGLIYVLGGYFLYAPPAAVGVPYFACAFIMFYIGWTLLEIPYVAWGGELAATSIEKTKVFSYRTAVGYGGLLLFYAMPLLPLFETTDITPKTLRWTAIAAGAMMLPFLYIAMTKVPDGHVPPDIRKASAAGPRETIGSWLRLFSGNRPYLILMAAYLTCGSSSGMWYGLIFSYVDAYLGLGAQFAQMFLLSFAIGIACTPLWYKVAFRLGRKAAWGISIALLAASFIYTGMLRPGETTFAELLTLKVVNTLGFVALNILVPSILSDVVDYGNLKFGVHRGASYFAVYTFGNKVVYALSAAIGLAIAGWYGFDPTVTEQTESGIFGMYLAIVWIPMAFVLVSSVFVVMIPMNARRHDIIRRRLEAREVRTRRQDAAANIAAVQTPLLRPTRTAGQKPQPSD